MLRSSKFCEKQVAQRDSFRFEPSSQLGIDAMCAFDGAFIVGLLEGWEPEETAEFANIVGALTTLGKGAVDPIPRRREVYEFVKA